MELWYPPDDQPPLLEWWTPLLLASAAARREQVPWPIHADEFELKGRVDRSGRPAIWVYRHRRANEELYLDHTGQPYKFTRTPQGRSYGRFTTCNIRTAVHRAGLPSHVEPVWYDEPYPPLRAGAPTLPFDDDEPWPGNEATGPHDDWAAGHVASHELSPPTAPPLTRPRRRKPKPGARRGHLTLIKGGRQAG
jgi:hypothetical protein